jgi:hypothetical protein
MALVGIGEKDIEFVKWLETIPLSDVLNVPILFVWPVVLYKITEKLISRKLHERKRNIDERFVEERVGKLRGIAKNEIEATDLFQSDKDERIRCFAAYDLAKSITGEQIERGLTDVSSSVREAYIRNTSLTLTPAQIERALSDEDFSVRRSMAFRGDYVTTAAQMERGLSDNNDAVRFWFFERCLVQEPSKEQIERGLSDRSTEIREWTAYRLKQRNDKILRDKNGRDCDY